MYSDDDYYEEEYSGYGHTGDPNLDRWDLRKSLFNSSINLTRLDYAVPEQVKKFLQYFQDMIKVIVKVQSTQSKYNRV